ncbi:MAG TPA: hypothetical protein VFI31_26725 [Pirellulales bacterium]|nr:hypothetical protein [Pirellulales bacterium]
MQDNPYESPSDGQRPREKRYVGCVSGCLWLSAFWIWLFVLAGLGFVIWMLWPLMFRE